jgi:hypothetical protein
MTKAEDTGLPSKKAEGLKGLNRRRSSIKIVVKGCNSISGNGAIIRKNLAQVRRGKVPEYWTKVVIDDET